jgi:large subunit ribosomal protein L33
MQEVVTLECTEAKKEGKPASRYLTKRNKKTVTERIEKKKYNPHRGAGIGRGRLGEWSWAR